MFVSQTLRTLLRKRPILIYILPVPTFFCAGACLEFAMIKWRPNDINFYDTFKKNRAKEIADKRLSALNNTSADVKIPPQQ